MPRMSEVGTERPVTSGPEWGLDLKHFQATYSLLSTSMHLSHSVGGDDRGRQSVHWQGLELA